MLWHLCTLWKFIHGPFIHYGYFNSEANEFWYFSATMVWRGLLILSGSKIDWFGLLSVHGILSIMRILAARIFLLSDTFSVQHSAPYKHVEKITLLTRLILVFRIYMKVFRVFILFMFFISGLLLILVINYHYFGFMFVDQ